MDLVACGGCAGCAVARHHAGLAAAVADGGEGGVRERDVCQARRGSKEMARDLTPLDQICILLV